MRPLQVWGGVECTVNRVRDAYFDQVSATGHHDRSADLDLFARLGISALRYPLLWERVVDAAGQPDWSWSDQRMERLRTLGIRPIVGLVHHGSGPPHTNLLAEGFAAGLGAFAGQVAARYPWVEDWTPVNEPLTTARFAALYGFWYPHARDEGCFWRALLGQVEGIVAAMSAIRRVNPAARLIQTDDLGRSYATPELADQAAFDNVRRWAGWDLLFGRVTMHHPLWERLVALGLEERLRRIADAPCPPDIVGVNHYLTSDRFLDHRFQRYPVRTHGANGSVRFADTEAVRVLDPPPQGFAGALREAWVRYRTPLALTEVHNGCTREEQLRWAAQAWDDAHALRGEGLDIRAVTAWSLLGNQGWDTLLTAPGRYEPGLFDVSSGQPRPTALADLWRGFPGDAQRHPVAEEPGWWHRPERLLHPRVQRPAPYGSSDDRVGRGRDTAPLLICGASGTLGQAFAQGCAVRAIRCILSSRDMLDLEREDSVAQLLDTVRPWAVINATGWARVDAAEDAEEACRRVNVEGAARLAEACAARGIGCVGFSSDLVFDGSASEPYTEDDTPRPLGAYGRSKHAMERACASLPGALIVRTAAVFSTFDSHNFAVRALDALHSGRIFAAAADHIVSPTFVPALVETVLDLVIDGAEGLWHVSGGAALSWAEFAVRLAGAADCDPRLVEPAPGATLNWRAARPRYAALTSRRGKVSFGFDWAIERFARDYRTRAAA